MKIENTGFAQFHVITQGTCFVTHSGEIDTCTTGDILLFPHGAGHVLSDQPNGSAIDGTAVMESFSSNQPMFSEGGQPTRLISGHYAYQSISSHPLILDLPELIHLKAAHILGEAPNLTVLPLILTELAANEPGQTTIVERFAEVLLIQTLRLYYDQAPAKPGFYLGLTNQQLVQAISHIHRKFSSRLTLGELAEIAAMSRSAFAKKFKQTTQISPIEYLFKWRMIKAANFLRSSDDSIANIAEQVGYDSAIAFARAFKQEYGVTPSVFRKSA